MSDDIERLLDRLRHQQDFGSRTEAADTIEALRAENARLYALLVEAQDYIDDIYDELYIAIGKELERHDLRAARAAIGERDND